MEQEDGRPPKPLRARHDGFTPAKQKKFFKALRKSGCIADAGRAAGISSNTVRRHRGKWPAFEANVEAALAIASVELDMIAWQRATIGAEEKVWREGKLVMTRVKPSDSMRRLLRAPAPDLDALALKIALAVDHEVATLTGGERCLAVLKADARRLAVSEGPLPYPRNSGRKTQTRARSRSNSSTKAAS